MCGLNNGEEKNSGDHGPKSLSPHCALTPHYGMQAHKNNAMKSHPGMKEEKGREHRGWERLGEMRGGEEGEKWRGTDRKWNKRKGRGAKGGN